MSGRLAFELLTPEGSKFSGDAYEIVLQTVDGQIAVLPGHVPLVTILVPGVLSIRQAANDPEERQERLACAGGVAEIDGKRVRVLADVAERAEDIDELKVKEALAKAQELKHAAADHTALADALSLIEINLARLKVTELKRRHRRQSDTLPPT